MTHEGDIAVRQLAHPDSFEPLSNLLCRAFAIEKYSESFPHIFSPASSARKFAAFDNKNSLLACCAIDTEIWSEPYYLRGGCIGSVAVDPEFQKRGIGRRLLASVIAQMREEQVHDFLYLFSDQPAFYESLGFRRAGTEILASFSAAENVVDSYQVFRPPVMTNALREIEKDRLWRAFERGRLSGESSAALAKFLQVVHIPDMCVSWMEDSQERIVAGAFVGKGIDFRGVVHSFFAENYLSMKSFWQHFRLHVKSFGPDLRVAAGLWSAQISGTFLQIEQQDLCLVRGLTLNTEAAAELFARGRIYPRALFSS